MLVFVVGRDTFLETASWVNYLRKHNSAMFAFFISTKLWNQKGSMHEFEGLKSKFVSSELYLLLYHWWFYSSIIMITTTILFIMGVSSYTTSIMRFDIFRYYWLWLLEINIFSISRWALQKGAYFTPFLYNPLHIWFYPSSLWIQFE